jgi:hypothetical protein
MSNCSLKTCLNCENGLCELSEFPFIFPNIQPNKIKCEFFDNDFVKTCQSFKNAGGVQAILLKKNKQMTESEIQTAKKLKRKSRGNKGK